MVITQKMSDKFAFTYKTAPKIYKIVLDMFPSSILISTHIYIHMYTTAGQSWPFGILVCIIPSCYVQHFVIPQIVSTEFSWQEYWNGLPFPPPGYLPTPGLNACLQSLLLCKQILYSLSHEEAPLLFWRQP